MHIYGGRSLDRQVARLVLADLSLLSVRLPKFLQLHLNCSELGMDVLGDYDHSAGKHMIRVRPGLSRGALYLVTLHELGHALGLEHMTQGVMAARLRTRRRKLTLYSRRKWLLDIAVQYQKLCLKELP